MLLALIAAAIEIERNPLEWESLFQWGVLGFLCLITFLLMLILLVLIIRKNR